MSESIYFMLAILILLQRQRMTCHLIFSILIHLFYHTCHLSSSAVQSLF